MAESGVLARTVRILGGMFGTFCAISIALYVYEKVQMPLPREIVGSDGALMVLIPAGAFPMGCSDGEPNEEPTHIVYLGAFYMDRYEVTTSRYARFLAATSQEPPFKWDDVDLRNDGERPVVGVNWHDAEEYCRWAGKRVPTEAEWEKAARGADGRVYPWGSADPTPDRGNYDRCCHWNGYSTLAIVGSFPTGRSPYGVDDLSTNVSEWTADWYEAGYYQVSPLRNPKGPSFSDDPRPSLLGDFRQKVVRGGSWVSGAKGLRSCLRLGDPPSRRHGDVGCRCATSVLGPERRS